MTLSLLVASIPELVAGVVGGLVLLYGWPRARAFRALVDRALVRPLAAVRRLPWDWRIVAAAIGVVFVVAAVVQSAPIPCSAGEDDTLALLQSGRNLLTGSNPFVTFQCGHSVHVPYGIASVLLDALGSLGGRIGIWLVWNLVALSLIPLTWALAVRERWYATLVVATTPVYAPLVVGSIQGGHSSIVPVAALIGIWLALRRNPAAGAVAGVLSTVKFPSLFPFWGGLSGTGTVRWRELAVSIAVFGALSVLVGLIWGNYAYSLLFSQQLTRADLSINEFGVLIPLHAMPPSAVLLAVQGLALLAGIVFVHLRKWAAIPAVALLTVIVALVAQRFTENFLIWLVPVALLGPLYARWLFALGAVGILNATVALPMCQQTGACGFSEGLGGLFGLGLVVLMVLILREWSPQFPGHSGDLASEPAPSPARPATEGPPGSFHSAPRFEGGPGSGGRPWPVPLGPTPPDG